MEIHLPLATTLTPNDWNLADDSTAVHRYLVLKGFLETQRHIQVDTQVTTSPHAIKLIRSWIQLLYPC
jgi:hypothetical protein